MVSRLDYLQRIVAAELPLDFKPVLSRLLAAIQAEMAGYGDYATLGSFLFNDLGTALVAHRLAPSAGLAELIYARAEGNAGLPVRKSRARLGRGRYSLWTGDVGLAIYLADCLRGEARFPTFDVS